ncbi:MAG TPA: ABC transporter ATP-binding protein, partial [Candidatus Hodarchaeales archaeon]|nr:ABC transporter ATP-binding protein [Candidatus Hodarchaeales archaeon]
MIPYLRMQKKLVVSVVLYSLLGTVLSLISPIAFAIGLDEVLKPSPDLSVIAFSSVGYLVILVVMWIFDYFYSITDSKLNIEVVYSLRRDLFGRVNLHDISFFDTNKTGKILSRISDDTFEVGGALTTVTDLFSTILRAMVLLGIMVLLDSFLTMIVLSIFPILFLFTFVLRRVIRKSTVLRRRVTATLNSFVEESINGIMITKSFSQERNITSNFRELQKQKFAVNVKQSTIMAIFSPLLDALTAIGLFIILVGGGGAILSGTMTAGFLYLFITYLRRLFGPIVDLSTFYATLQGGFAAAERIFSMMDVPTKMKLGSIKVPPLRGEIEFKNVSFRYDTNRDYVFRNFDIHIPAGQVVAVVGETGAGKTSFAGLLSRMYEFEDGEIILDGEFSIQDVDPDSLRGQLGYVLQEPFLFSGTILDNLLLGYPDASEVRVQGAIEAVGADTFVKMLPKGLSTEIMERGRGLSQGQRQLL